MFRVHKDHNQLTFPDNIFLTGNWFRPRWMGNGDRRLKNVEAVLEWMPADSTIRNFIVVTLAEAETLRRVMHRRQPSTRGVALALHTLHGFCNDDPWILQDTPDYTPDHNSLNSRTCMETLRFLNSDMYYTDDQINLVCRGLDASQYARRRNFFDGCIARRRRMKQSTEGTPVEKIFTPPSEIQHLFAVKLISQLKKKISDRNKKPKKIRGAPDEWSGLRGDEIFEKAAEGGSGISREQLMNLFEEFGLQLRAEDIASIYTYANVDEDLVLDREEWRNKFDIPDPMPVKIRMWKCKSERCTTTEEGFDEWTQLPNEYPEELKFCPVCGDPQKFEDPADVGNPLVTILTPNGVMWCCLQGEACMAQKQWGGYRNPMSARHCDLCGQARPGT